MKRILLTPFIWLAATLFLIEEFIWDTTAKLMARLGAIQLIHSLERRIVALSPRLAVIAFLLPVCTVIPAKLIGLYAIEHQHWLTGACVFLTAKLIGVALFSRVFNLTRPALLQITWFARLYGKTMFYRNRIHAYLDQWAAYQQFRQRIRTLFVDVKK